MSHSIIGVKILNFYDGGCGTVWTRSHNRVPVGWWVIRGIGCNGELLLPLAVLLVLGMEWSRCHLVVPICGAHGPFDRYGRLLSSHVNRPTNDPASSHGFVVQSLHDH